MKYRPTCNQQGCRYDPVTHAVTTPDGFKEAYRQFTAGGWASLDAPVEFGGQGLPHTLKFIVDEMVCSANLSLGMYAGLTHGAISALYAHGSQELRQTYLSRLVSGEWAGTMCLTEPQCGTDLGMIRTRATPRADGSYGIAGTKIWITGGEHDLVDNIVHLVLAKLPGAPNSTRGLSSFLVPKVIPHTGERNPAYCGGLEHKMGIKGSATAVMNFEDAQGWPVGQPNEGMRALALFTGHQLDLSVAHPDAAVREAGDDLVQLLTPVVKAFLTDEGFNNANLGLQVLGGAGFTTDWPLEQLVRDGRIPRIYEGTNGIQAMDLVGRKLGLKGGRLIGLLSARAAPGALFHRRRPSSPCSHHPPR